MSFGTALAATAACSLSVGFDGFVGPTPEEAGGPGAQDGSVLAEASRDGAVEGDAASGERDAEADSTTPDPNVGPLFVDGGNYCSDMGAIAFCDDFDTAELSARWVREGAYAKLTSHASRSTPNNFLVNAPAANTGGVFVSKITRAFDAPSTNMALAFDFMPERIYVGASFLIMAAVEYTRNDAKYSLRLVYNNGEVRLEESNLVPPPNNKDTYHPFFAFPADKWSRIKLDIVASGASPGVTISLDDVAVGLREPITPTAGMDPRPTLLLGAVYAGNPQTGWTLRYDNLTVANR